MVPLASLAQIAVQAAGLAIPHEAEGLGGANLCMVIMTGLQESDRATIGYRGSRINTGDARVRGSGGPFAR